MSSPAFPTIATGCPSLTWLPAGTSNARIVVSSKARNSIVALSVSTSARTSSTATVSPGFLCHAASTPSSIVGESLGISRSLAMDVIRMRREVRKL